MKSITFVIKNIVYRFWRTITLGFFVCIVSMLMVFFGSFSAAVKNKADDVIINGFTGHIQLRSDQTREGDMVVQYTAEWDALEPVPPAICRKTEHIIRTAIPHAEVTGRIRQTADIIGKNKQEETLLIGLDPSDKKYRSVFLLNQGEYLSPSPRPGIPQILITTEQAKKTRAGLHDTVALVAKNKHGRNTRMHAEITGIGDFILLSMFSYRACLLDRNTLMRFLDFSPGEYTELLIMLPDKTGAAAAADRLSALMNSSGIKTTLTRSETTTSEDLKITSFDSLRESSQKNGIKISVYTEMGEMFRNTGNIVSLSLMLLFAVLLCITAMMIFNIVTMTGLDRKREIGTLRVFGFSSGRILLMILSEILSAAVLFAGIGILCASMIILVFGSNIPAPLPALVFFMGDTMTLPLDPVFTGTGFFFVILFTGIASVFPLLRSCKVPPREILSGADR